MPIPATPRQREALRFIHGYQLAHGCAPTLSEMARCAGLGTKSAAQRVVGQLVARGLVRRKPATTRGIALLVKPAVPFAPDGAPLFLVPGIGERG